MAIIYPPLCRGTTTGALRQIKQSGATTACGGLFDPRLVRGVVRGNRRELFQRTEPAGAFMAALEDTKTAIEENTDAIQKASHRLVDTARDANKSMSDVTGKFRAGTEHLGVAIDKLVKIAGRSDFAQIVQQAESLATSLERLAALEQSGMLERVMYAMTPPPVDIEG